MILLVRANGMNTVDWRQLMQVKAPNNLSAIANVSASTRSAWYTELKKCPPLLGNADIRNVLGIGQTKAWSLMQQLGATKVGTRLKLDRNVLIAYLLSSRVHENEQ